MRLDSRGPMLSAMMPLRHDTAFARNEMVKMRFRRTSWALHLARPRCLGAPMADESDDASEGGGLTSPSDESDDDELSVQSSSYWPSSLRTTSIPGQP